MKLNFIITSHSYDEAYNKAVNLCIRYHAELLCNSSERIQNALRPFTEDMVNRSINIGGYLHVTAKF